MEVEPPLIIIAKQEAVIKVLREEIFRLRARNKERKNRAERMDLTEDALHGKEVQELRRLLDVHQGIVYEALRTRPSVQNEKYKTLVALCDVKRSYEVPPEYSGILHIEKRDRWSPVDTEIARVLVSVTIADPMFRVLYVDLVSRIDNVVSIARPHIYRSLKAVLRDPPGRGGIVYGIRLR